MKVRVYGHDGITEGTLFVNGLPFDEEVMARSPFFRMVADAEHDLLERHRRGELICEDADSR